MLSELTEYAFTNIILHNCYLILTFSISFIFFKFYFKNCNLSADERHNRHILAETYLLRHKNSDSDFFYGNNDLHESTPEIIESNIVVDF